MLITLSSKLLMKTALTAFAAAAQGARVADVPGDQLDAGQGDPLGVAEALVADECKGGGY